MWLHDLLLLAVLLHSGHSIECSISGRFLFVGSQPIALLLAQGLLACDLTRHCLLVLQVSS